MDYKGINDYELIYRIRENDEDAVCVMIDKYEPIIISIAKKYYLRFKKYGVEMDDLIQEGRIAVLRAINSYDVDNTTLFYTYVSICIDRQLLSLGRSLTATKHAPLNYSVSDDMLYFVGDSTLEPATCFQHKCDENLLIRAKNFFDFPDSNIFELRYNGFSYKEISRLLDLSYGSIDSRLCKIRRTLQRIKDKF